MNNFSDIGYLIQQLTACDEEAWEYFIGHYGRLIYYCINKYRRRYSLQEDIDDCFQEVLRVLLEDNCKRFKTIRTTEEKVFRSWLGVVATRRAINFFRGKKEASSLPDEILDLIRDQSNLPDLETLRIQIRDIIQQKLSSKERTVMIYFLDGWTLAEISQTMGIGITSVHKIIKNATEKIRKYLNIGINVCE